jgi:flagellar hook assembly protein FlgD
MKLYQIIIALFIMIAIVGIFIFTSELKAEDSHNMPVQIIPSLRTDGTVNFQVLTLTNHGQYSTRNIGAIWITTESGTFVKTLQRWGNSYLQFLTKWHSFTSTGNVTGAITGATLSTHTLHNVNWNCKNTSNVEVADGNYKVWVEFTESNGAGPNTSVTFTKGAGSVHLTPANLTYFHNLLVDFTPSIVISAPTNLQANVMAPNVSLTWSAPASTSGLTAYKVYRDGSLLATTLNATTTSYNDIPAQGNHSYYVTAMFGTTESAASNTVTVSNIANDDSYQSSNLTALQGNYPNPFNPETNIRFSLEKTQNANLSIYNFKGQKVKTLAEGNMAGGQHVVSWNGKSDSGNRVASGFYYYRLQTKDKTIIKKMILLK